MYFTIIKKETLKISPQTTQQLQHYNVLSGLEDAFLLIGCLWWPRLLTPQGQALTGRLPRLGMNHQPASRQQQ